MNNRKYEYLFWDIDGTVLNFKAAEKAAIQALFPKFGLGECTDEMVERYSAINVKYWEALERNEMTKPEILVGRFTEFFETEGLDSKLSKEFNAAYQLALGDTIVFCDDAKSILMEEKSEFKLVAITNGTTEAQNKKFKASGLVDIFDAIYISEQVGYEKPNREFFDNVLRELDITDLSRILIIGDSLTSDIKGGFNMGIDTCWYNPGGVCNPYEYSPTYVIKDLHELTNII